MTLVGISRTNPPAPLCLAGFRNTPPAQIDGMGKVVTWGKRKGMVGGKELQKFVFGNELVVYS